MSQPILKKDKTVSQLFPPAVLWVLAQLFDLFFLSLQIGVSLWVFGACLCVKNGRLLLMFLMIR